MTGKTHQILGITTGLAYILAVSEPIYSPATFGAVLVGSHLAALLPDFDESSAKFWQSLPYGQVAGRVFDPFIAHRNFSHSILGVGILFGAAKLLLDAFPAYWGINTSTVLIAIVLAYISHLLADMLTAEGIPLLFPYKRMFGIPPKPFEGFRILTGKWFENIIIFPLLNLALIITVIANWPTIKSYLFK